MKLEGFCFFARVFRFRGHLSQVHALRRTMKRSYRLSVIARLSLLRAGGGTQEQMSTSCNRIFERRTWVFIADGIWRARC